MEKEKHQIELRSEKIRNVMGEMPRSLIRWSNVVLTIIAIGLAIALLYAYKFSA